MTDDMTMRTIHNVDENSWWSVAHRCHYATFFHTPLWHRLVCSTYEEYQDRTLGIRLENGTQAIFPLLETTQHPLKPFFRNLSSTFAGCYGGLIADGPVTLDEMEQIYERVCSWRVGLVRITGNPIAVEQRVPSGFSERRDFTHILHLAPEFDEIVANFSKGHRYNLRKGKRMGVSVRIAQSMEDYRAYFGAYENSLNRWGDNVTSSYPWQLFQGGFGLSQEYPENLTLWLAEVKGDVVAGAWVFYWNRHAVWWHGAAYEEYFDYYPNNVLQAAIIEDAVERGFKYYDFNPSGGHEGVAKFKSRFGAERRTVTRSTYQSPVIQFLRRWTQILR